MHLHTLITSLFITNGLVWAETGSYEIEQRKALAKVAELKKFIGDNPLVVGSIKKQNAQRLSLGSIKKLDNKWRNSFGVPSFMKPYLHNECSDYLRLLKKKINYALEIFVMDNQGALVCLSDRTSDYWQGDEDKWLQTYAKGKDAVFVAKPGFDASAQEFLVQVSFSIQSESQVIGAATVGIFVEQLGSH